jgi:hypothetical protein
MAVTQESIWKAADALDAEGIRPPPAAVRRRIGSGSFTTISEAMSDWRAHRQAGARADQEPAPPEVAERAGTLASELDTLRGVQAAHDQLAGELAELKRKTAAEIHRAMEKATAKDSEAIEARKDGRAAIARAGRAEGQVQVLKEQLAELTVTLRPAQGGRG